jgi:hypothetical protein
MSSERGRIRMREKSAEGRGKCGNSKIIIPDFLVYFAKSGLLLIRAANRKENEGKGMTCLCSSFLLSRSLASLMIVNPIRKVRKEGEGGERKIKKNVNSVDWCCTRFIHTLAHTRLVWAVDDDTLH